MWNASFFFISNRFYKTQNNFGPFNDHIITEFSWVVTMAPAQSVMKMAQIAYSGFFWTQFRVSRDLFTNLTAGKATVRTFLPHLLTATNRIQNCTHRKIITYQTPKSNLPIDIYDNSRLLWDSEV